MATPLRIDGRSNRPRPIDPPVFTPISAPLREVLQNPRPYKPTDATCICGRSAQCHATVTQRAGRGTWTRHCADKSLATAGSNLRSPGRRIQPPPQPVWANARSNASKSLTTWLNLVLGARTHATVGVELTTSWTNACSKRLRPLGQALMRMRGFRPCPLQGVPKRMVMRGVPKLMVMRGVPNIGG